MGRTVALDAAGAAFAREEFGRYYRESRVDPPERFTRREFAAFPFGPSGAMRRHASFRTAESFRAFLAGEAPRHVYYSTAYYRQPDHAVMAEKGWLGADLVFDLDADHLRHAEGLDYPGQLRLVKERFRRLLDDFLFGDFGLDPELTTIVFSGGRGYHLHVRDPRYLELTSAERRELVEYILGVGVDPHDALREELASESGPLALVAGGGGASAGEGPRRRPRAFQGLVSPEAPGWPGRVSRAVQELVSRWEVEGEAAARAEIELAGVERRTAGRLARELVREGKARWVREGLTLEVFRGKDASAFLEVVLKLATVEVQGETDAPVTTDIHRLIRLPLSRHGGTGLVVRPLTREGLDAFEPLRDAVVPDGALPRATVWPTATLRYPFGGGLLDVTEGEPAELGRSAALFLLLRGEASLTPPEPPASR